MPPTPTPNNNRLLTDEDVQAITDALEQRVVERFYGDLGKGVWTLVWRAIVLGILAVAVYGSTKGFK
ncbi:hypothetical protein DAPPUDRAFT_343363 [Daphnia pulex]|uniref:Uncharacterized protein n=1 Tax=Daphnia pulex TaxID=6669 RepID=E9I6P6_DAPPU|nr:hypothetical protein DAPPUDRAFT_343363 [Daphnia pulex]|eukprot:EFX60334.1 hypothetical protein DAPPUDRAFT_343363 [Daphnia pulex]